jgi:hypothetical protein
MLPLHWRLHRAHLMLHAEQHAEHVGVESGRVAFGGLFRHRKGLAFGAGVVDRHVKLAEAGHRLVDQAAHRDAPLNEHREFSQSGLVLLAADARSPLAEDDDRLSSRVIARRAWSLGATKRAGQRSPKKNRLKNRFNFCFSNGDGDGL